QARRALRVAAQLVDDPGGGAGQRLPDGDLVEAALGRAGEGPGGPQQADQEQADAAGAGLDGDGVEGGGGGAGRPEVAARAGADGVEQPAAEVDGHVGGLLLGVGDRGGPAGGGPVGGGGRVVARDVQRRAPAARRHPVPLPPEGGQDGGRAQAVVRPGGHRRQVVFG